jgi:hypothetical protein
VVCTLSKLENYTGGSITENMAKTGFVIILNMEIWSRLTQNTIGARYVL